MSDEKLDFLDETEGTEAEQVTQEPEAVEPAAAEPEPEPQKAEEGEQPAEPEEPDTGEKKQASPPDAEAEKEKHAVPITAVLDEREKRQAAEKRLKELEAQMQQSQQKRPDFYENPEAALNQAVTTQKLQQSRFFAEREFGKEEVQEAVEFFNDPQFAPISHQLMQEPSPFHAAVEFARRQKVLREMGEDPDAYINQRVEQELQKRLAEAQPAPQSSQPQTPPPSMAKAASSGRDAITPGSAFDQVIPD